MLRITISSLLVIAGCAAPADLDTTDVSANGEDALSTDAANASRDMPAASGRDIGGFEPLEATGGTAACFTAADLPAVIYQAAAIPADVCQCIADTDGRPFNPGFDQSAAPLPTPEVRDADPEFAYWRTEVARTTCGCCHNTLFEGSGTLYWDSSYPGVFTDTFTDARLLKWAGLTSQGEPGDTSRPGQFLPVPDKERLRDFVREELARREAARQ